MWGVGRDAALSVELSPGVTPPGPFAGGHLGDSTCGAARRGLGLLPWLATSPLPKGPRSSSGHSQSDICDKSPGPRPSAPLHEELRKQRREPALVHHTQRCPHAAATCSGHLGNLLCLCPTGIPLSLPWAAAPLTRFCPWPILGWGRARCPLSSQTLELILSPGTQRTKSGQCPSQRGAGDSSRAGLSIQSQSEQECCGIRTAVPAREDSPDLSPAWWLAVLEGKAEGLCPSRVAQR